MKKEPNRTIQFLKTFRGAVFVLKTWDVFSDTFGQVSHVKPVIWYASKTLQLKSLRKSKRQQPLRNFLSLSSWWILESHRMSQKPGRLWGEHCEVEKSGWHFWHCPKKREKLDYYYLGSIKFEIINWQMFPSSPRTIRKVPLSQSALPSGKLLAWCRLRT